MKAKFDMTDLVSSHTSSIWNREGKSNIFFKKNYGGHSNTYATWHFPLFSIVVKKKKASLIDLLFTIVVKEKKARLIDYSDLIKKHFRSNSILI